MVPEAGVVTICTREEDDECVKPLKFSVTKMRHHELAYYHVYDVWKITQKRDVGASDEGERSEEKTARQIAKLWKRENKRILRSSACLGQVKAQGL